MLEILTTATTEMIACLVGISRRAVVGLRVRFAMLRAAPDAGYSTEFWVVTATVVAVALTALGIWAADVLSAAHNIQLTNTPGG